MPNKTNHSSSLKSTSSPAAAPAAESADNAAPQNSAATNGPNLYASLAVIRNEAELREFESLRDGLLEDLKPFVGMETIAFEQILISTWTMRRCNRRIAELAAQGLDPIDCSEASLPAKQLRQLDLQYRRAESTFNRSTKLLRELQTERAYREASGTAELTRNLSALVRTQPLRKASLNEDWTKTQIEAASLRTATKVPEFTAHRYSRDNSENLLRRL